MEDSAAGREAGWEEVEVETGWVLGVYPATMAQRDRDRQGS